MTDSFYQIKPKILVVDDDDEELILFSLNFCDYFDITTATSADEGMEKLIKIKPDLVITDFEMPEKNGLDFLREIKKASPDLPVIFYTGQGNEDIAREAFVLGASDYFVKAMGSFIHKEKILNSVKKALVIKSSRDKQEATQKQLAESEHRYRSIVESIVDSLFIHNIEGIILDVNDTSVKFTGYSYSQLIGLNLEKILFDESGEKLLTYKNRLLREGKVLFECFCISKSGKMLPVEVSSKIVSRQNRGIIHTFIRDVSERKKYEKELRNTVSILEEAFEQTPIPMALCNYPEKTFQIMNTACRKFLGIMDEPKPIGKHIEEFKQTWCGFYADGNPLPLEQTALAKALEGQFTLNMEFYIITKSKDTRWGLVTGAPIYNPEGERVGAFAIFPDITNIKKIEEALINSEERFRKVFDGNTAFIIHDFNGRIVDVNSVACNIYGYTREEFLEKNVLDFDTDMSFDELQALWEDVLINKGLNFETHNKNRDGMIFAVDIKIVPFEYSDPPLFFAAINTIGSREKQEEALRFRDNVYRNLFNTTKDAIFLLKNRKFIDCNLKTLKLFNCNRAELINKDFLDYCPVYQPNGKKSSEEIARFVTQAKQEPQLFEWLVQINNRDKLLVEISMNIIEAGEDVYIQAVTRDITSRKSAEKQLEIVRDLALELNKTATFKEALSHCLSSAMKMAEMDSGGIYIINQDNCLELAVSHGLSEDFVRACSEYDPESKNYKIIMQGKSVFFEEHVQMDVTLDQFRRNEKLRSVAIIPVKSQEKIVACLNIASHKYGKIPELVRNGLESIASWIGPAIIQKQTEEALRNSEKRFSHVVNSMRDAYFMADISGHFTYVSPYTVELYGYDSMDEMIGMLADNLYKDKNIRLEVLDELKSKGFVHDKIGLGRKKDGSYIWVSLNAQFYFDENGKIAGTEGLVRDITQRKRAEQEQILIAEILSVLSGKTDLFELSRQIAVTLKEWSGCESVGVRFKDGDSYPYLGYTGFTGLSISDENNLCATIPETSNVTGSNADQNQICLCSRVINGDINYDSPCFTKYGSFWTNDAGETAKHLVVRNFGGQRCITGGYESVALVPIKISDTCFGLLQLNDRKKGFFSEEMIEQIERISGILSTGLSERIAEQALENHRQFLSRIIDGLPIPLFVIDNNHNVTHWNRAMAEYTGIKSEEIKGTSSYWKAFYKQKQPLVADLIIDGKVSEITKLFENRYKPSKLIDGAFEGLEFFSHLGRKGKWLNFTVAEVRDEQGKTIGVISNLEDVTDKIEYEKKISAVNSELSDFAYRVSHDLKKPINVIRGYSQLLKEQLPEENTFVAKIIENSQRMLKFIDEELKLAKAGLTMSAKQDVNLEELLDEIKTPEILQDCPVDLILRKPLLNVAGDRHRLHLVFNNLFENSVNYRDVNKDKLIIKICTDETEDSVRIIFEDNGTGIEARHLQYIFKPGYTINAKQGTGFGLAIVKKIIEAHGGSVSVDSEGRNKGTSFTIKLPK